MSKTAWADNGRGRCDNCGKDLELYHLDPVPPENARTCRASLVYVFRALYERDLPMARAALEQLKTFHLANDCKLRIVGRDATGDDDWSHDYWWTPGRWDEPVDYVLVMDGRAGKYTTTLEQLKTAWEFFQHGWQARDKYTPPVKEKIARGPKRPKAV